MKTTLLCKQANFLRKSRGIAILTLFLLGTVAGTAQTQIGQDIDGEAPFDNAGISVSISSDGSIVALGSNVNDDNGNNSGHVRVFENINDVWTQIGQNIEGEAAGDQSGSSVSISNNGSIVAIGAPFSDGNGTDSGQVRVFENLNGTWTQIGQDIDGEAAGDESGLTIGLSGDGSIVAIGAGLNDGNGNASGHVRVFENVNGVWTQIGQDIDGEVAANFSGTGLSISNDGSIVAIGAYQNNNPSGQQAGHVRIFQNQGGSWSQIALDIDGEAGFNRFGQAVSLSSDGLTVAIGAPNNNGNNGNQSGHVRVFTQGQGAVWTQIGQDIDGEASGDSSGAFQTVSLSADGNLVAIGASANDGNGGNSGHVRLFENQNGTWVQVGQDIDGEAAGDFSGRLSLSGDGSTVAIGASSNDDNGNNSGHVRVFSTTPGSNDTTPPIAVCQNITVQLDASGNATITPAQIDNGSADDSGSFTLSLDTTSFTCADIGANTVTLTVTDGAGNTDTCTATVTVEDSIGPTISCPADITIECDASTDPANTGMATATDNCDASPFVIFADAVNGNMITRTWAATDDTGNQVLCTQLITLQDTTAPNLTCPVSITIECDASTDPANTGMATATDNCDASPSITFTDVVNGGVSSTITRTWTATDASGNAVSCDQFIFLQDTVAPTLSCPAATVTVGVDANTNQYTVEDFIANSMVTVSDNCDSPVPNISQTPAPGTQLGGGTFTVTITAEDSLGNSASCSFDVFVDTTLSVTENQLAAVGLYPNPASRIVNLSNPQGISLDGIAIYDITGRLVQEVNPTQTGETLPIDIANLTDGLYMVILSANNNTLTKRLVVNHQ